MTLRTVASLVAAGTMVGGTVASSLAADTINYLRRPNDVSSWSSDRNGSADIKLEQDDHAIRMTVVQPGAEDWHLQVYQANLPLQEGQTYTMHFRAKSDAPRTYSCYVGTGVPDYHAVSPVITFQVTPEWKPVTLQFTATNVVENASRGPLFALGKQSGTLWIADAAIEGPKPKAETPTMPAGFFPFAIPWDDTISGVATDVSFLNEKPAGSNGFIVVKDGHFAEANTGKRIRFFGTNLGAAEAFPEKADAELFAKRLAKAGVNIVRLHHLDNTWSIGTGSIWDKNYPDRQHFDPAQLDKLDYLISQLKANGIYVNLNLKVSKELTPADGMPESVKQIPFTLQKRVDFFQRRMIDLQKDYARKLLTHKNPYTGMAYTDDPAVACVEINNENSLISYWSRTPGRGLEKLPEPFKTELETLWTTWLKNRYGSDDKLKAAWLKGVTPMGESILSPSSQWTQEAQGESAAQLTVNPSADPHAAPEAVVQVQRNDATDWHVQTHVDGVTLQEGALYTLSFKVKAERHTSIGVNMNKDIEDWHNMGLQSTVDVGKELRPYTLTFKATGTAPEHARIAFVLGNSTGTVWLSDIRLSPGVKGVGLQEGESLATRVHLPVSASDPQWNDYLQFLVDTERAYSDEMRQLLKDELEVHANVALTQIDYGGTAGMNREQKMEYADAHAYWQHPNFANNDWNPEAWTIANTPQVAAFGDRNVGELGNLAMTRVAGKPFSVSEYDHPAPSDYVCEMMPEYATFASLQDWDIIYTFAVGNYSSQEKPDRILGYFDQNNHPAKWAFYPTAALIFRQGMIQPAKAQHILQMPAPMWQSYAFVDDAWRALAGPQIGFLDSQLATNDRPLPAGETPRIGTVDDLSRQTSRVELRKTPAGQVYVASAPSAVAFVGYIGGETLSATDASLSTATFSNNFAAVTAVATDNQPLASSKRILVTICGRVENQGMGWNATRTTIGSKWGQGPSIAQYVPAQVTLKTSGARKVYALSPSGKRAHEVPTTVRDAQVTFTTQRADTTLLYEVAAE